MKPVVSPRGGAASSPEPRPLRPRAPVVVRPAFVSQENCHEVLGVDPRRFLELLVPRCKGEVTSLGKLRLIPIDVAEARLRALAGTPEELSSDDSPTTPETVDGVLAQLGRRRTA